MECATSRDCTQRTQCLVDEAGLGACQLGDETRCTSNSECPEGLACGQGRCLNECAADRDCLAGATCVRPGGGGEEACDGATGCVCRDRAQVACLYDGDCRSGDDPAAWLACIGGACRPECVTDRDCASFNCLPLLPELGVDGGYCGLEGECERWYVREGATGNGVGGWAGASGDLAGVLAAAAAREACGEIWIAEGRYVPPDAGGFRVGSGIRLYGGFAGDELAVTGRHGEATQLSGDLAGDDPGSRMDNANHVVDIAASSTGILLDGLTVRGGNATGAGADGAGGGIRVGASATEVVLRDVVLVDNHASGGGGLSVLGGASVDVERGSFDNNRAPDLGGGAADHVGGRARYVDCTFRGNSGNGAGAINAISGATVELLRCELEDNTAATLGGAMRVGASGESATMTIVSSSFRSNLAASGGAIHVANADSVLRLVNVVAWDNRATGDGGALSVTEGALAQIATSTLARNQAGGDGGAIQLTLPGRLEMTNSVAWGNTSSALDPADAQIAGDRSSVSWCAVEGLASGEGNVGTGVVFEDLDGGADVGLAPGLGSTALGAGDATRLPADELDTDGDADVTEPLPTDRVGRARLRGGALDMGAVQGE